MQRNEGLLYPSGHWLSLLKACLVHGPQGEKAWSDWQTTAGGPTALLDVEWAPAKRWWPLLWMALSRNRLDVARKIRIPLKSACAAETIRHARCRRIAASAVSALTGADCKPVLLKGMALADTVYERTFLRHCHGIDIWVRAGDPRQAAEALAPGFNADPGYEASPGSSHRLVHNSGLPLRLRAHVFESGCNITRTSLVTNNGLLCDTLPKEYALIQVFREAGQEEDFPFAWISDACHLLRSPGLTNSEQLNLIFSRSDEGGMLCERLEYLQEVFGACSDC